MTLATWSDPASVQEEQSRRIIDAVTDFGIYMLDAEGHVVSWNSGAERIKGYTEAEIVGKHFSCFFTASDRQANIPRLVLETARRDGRFECEGWRVRKDGSSFWVQAVVDVINDPSGRLIGFAKITRDLTERRRSEQVLRQSEQRFAHLVQAVGDYAIYMLDTGGMVVNWNLGAERIKGYRADEIVGRHFSQFYTQKDRVAGAPQHNLRCAVRDGRYEQEGWRVRRDGSTFWANVIITPISDHEGVLLGFAKVTRDVTERVTVHRALEQAREAFFHSQKMEAVGQLTAGIVHDFNNVLMAVLGNLETLQMRLPFDPALTPLVGRALQGAERGTALTKRMLAFARRGDQTSGTVAIPDVVEGVSEILKQSIGPAIQIESRFPVGLPAVDVDANQLELALLNLVLNARDAMPGSGTITIEARENTIADGIVPSWHFVVLSVKDTGEGMDDQTLGRAMEPSFTTKPEGSGTGLGLSMVQGFVEQHRGQLTLHSVKGSGTTVELRLPITEPGSPPDWTQPPVAGRPVPPPADLQPAIEPSSAPVAVASDENRESRGLSNLHHGQFPVVMVNQQVGMVPGAIGEPPRLTRSADCGDVLPSAVPITGSDRPLAPPPVSLPQARIAAMFMSFRRRFIGL